MTYLNTLGKKSYLNQIPVKLSRFCCFSCTFCPQWYAEFIFKRDTHCAVNLLAQIWKCSFMPYSITNSTLRQSWNDVSSLRVLRLEYQIHLHTHQETGSAQAALKELQFCSRNKMIMETAVKAGLGRWAVNVLHTLKPEKLSVRFWQTRPRWYFSNFTSLWKVALHQLSSVAMLLPASRDPIFLSCTPSQTWGLLCNMTTAHYKHQKTFRKMYFWLSRLM